MNTHEKSLQIETSSLNGQKSASNLLVVAVGGLVS
jgi:hypothetical protein